MRLRALVILLALSACASAPPTPSPSDSPSSPEAPAVDCGPLADALCESVADAAELMTGTAPLVVAEFPAPNDGGTPIEERYVVTLEPEAGERETQLVEVVRLEDSDNWSVRRLETMPSD